MINETRNAIETAAESGRTNIRTLNGDESWRGVYYLLEGDI